MNILYFGTVCNLKNYEEILKNCNNKPTLATVVFESALLSGMKKNGANMEVVSFPMIPTFPNSNLLSFGGNNEELPCGYVSHWLRTINLPVLKQLSRRLDAEKAIKRWSKTNQGSGVILTYSIPPFLVKSIIKYAKKYHLKTVAIVPDLPQNMYINHNDGSLKYKLKQLYLKASLKYQGAFDGYVYLTKYMKDVVAPSKPCMILEGIITPDKINYEDVVPEKVQPKAIMYAGRLHEKYGVINLLDAFEQIEDSQVQLWLFGDGTAVPEIERRIKQNSRIKYFGMISQNEILEYERKATLLVNPRGVKDDFTKYSFPSKTIEYMYSGTPLLTTKLKGIPEEYIDYVFAVEDNSPSQLAGAIKEALSLPEAELKAMGEKARCFIQNNKNAYIQSNRVLKFLNNVAGD